MSRVVYSHAHTVNAINSRKAAIDTVLLQLRNTSSLLKSCRTFQSKRAAGEVKQKDSKACSEAFAVYEACTDNRPFSSLPWFLRSCKVLAKYTYAISEKAHPTSKFERGQTMSEQRCSEDQFATLMSDLTTDSIDSIIKIAHEEKMPKPDLRSHLLVFCDQAVLGSMSPSFQQVLVHVGNALRYDRVTKSELDNALKYIDEKHESDRVLQALRHWPSGAGLLADAREAQAVHTNNQDNSKAFKEQGPAAEALAAKAKEEVVDDSWYVEFKALSTRVGGLMHDTSMAYKSENTQQMTRLTAALADIHSAMLPKLQRSIKSVLDGFEGNPK